MLSTTREQLAQVEDRIRALREEKRRSAQIKAAAVESAADGDDSATHTAEIAAQGLEDVDKRLDAAVEQRTGLLRRLGDQEANMPGFTWPNADGWGEAARKLSLTDGHLRIDVSAQSLLQPVAAPPLSASPTTPTTPTPPGSRYVYPAFASANFGPSVGDMAATDYVVTSLSEPGLTGIEIEPATATEKQELNVGVALATPTAKTFAVTVPNVPAKLFDTRDSLRSFLSGEMARRLDEAYDAHVVSAIQTAAPPNGSTGTGLVAQLRHAISDMRDLGGEPSVVALSPADAAALDLSEDTSGSLIFSVKAASGGDGVWTLRVRESRSVTDPLLIDPSRLGLNYLDVGSVLADPYSSMTTNRVRVRVEVEAKFHVRNVHQGAFVIA